jgi:hypothetical protein
MTFQGENPKGKPEVMFSMPGLYNSVSRHHKVNISDVSICTELYSSI